MISFSTRSYQKELLDRNDIPFEDIRQNMRELDLINTRLGGHRISAAGISTLLKNTSGQPTSIVEIGCGGGDNLRAIKRWALKNKVEIKLSGIDINEACIEYATTVPENDGINFINSDYRNVNFSEPPQIIFSSLFCHHFTDEELVLQLRWMHQNSITGFFINDLHRHPAAYYSISLLTKMFSKSYLVKNDAPLSVCRGFKRKEWTHLFSQAGIENYNCQWRWAFRWLIICKCN
jgi:2-polyprenyl-3-methyl-5-hydroxy-6-metoxy-1,4-benzoquinol methylase